MFLAALTATSIFLLIVTPIIRNYCGITGFRVSLQYKANQFRFDIRILDSVPDNFQSLGNSPDAH